MTVSYFVCKQSTVNGIRFSVVWSEICVGEEPTDVSMGWWDQQTSAQAPGGARAGKFVQGIPFVGQYADEAIGALSGDGAMRGARALQSAMDRQHPVESVALQTAGGHVGSAPVLAAAAPSVIPRRGFHYRTVSSTHLTPPT